MAILVPAESVVLRVVYESIVGLLTSYFLVPSSYFLVISSFFQVAFPSCMNE